jgi:hypothetical protein
MLGTNGAINSSAETTITAEAEKGDEEEELNVPLLRKYNSRFLLLFVLVRSAGPLIA